MLLFVSKTDSSMVLDASGIKRMIMKVKDFMTPSPVYSCSKDTSLPEAARIMKEANCGMLPVLDSDSKVIGIITDRDICLAVAGTNGKDINATKIADIYSGKVYSTGPGDNMEDALRIMRTKSVSRVPVIDDQGHLAGILSVNDILLRVVEFDKGGKDDQNGNAEYETLYRTLSALIRQHNTIPDLEGRNTGNTFEVY